MCRPDVHRSRPFGSLSGGQQALATLALSLALQAAFPSPFYFFDEIDSALDTSNASRVAQYIASQKGAQYLVVSHKPQVPFCSNQLLTGTKAILLPPCIRSPCLHDQPRTAKQVQAIHTACVPSCPATAERFTFAVGLA